MTILLNENDKKLKTQYSNIVSQIFENVSDYQDDEEEESNTLEIEEFPQVFEFINKFLNSELNEENLLNIECALHLLSSNYPDLQVEFIENKNNFINSFRNFFKTSSLSLKTKTARTISEIISFCDRDEAKIFNEFLMSILENTLRCFENPSEEANLKLSLQSIVEIIHSHPKMLVKHFSDLYILMTKIIEKKDYLDEKIRDVGFEVIVKFVERVPNVLKKDKEKLNHFVELIYKYCLEMDKEITDDWSNPKENDYLDEEVITDEKLSSAFSFIDRLVTVVKEETLVELQKIIVKLLEVDGDYIYKYIALLSISEITNHIDDISHIENIFPKIFELISHENPKVRNAAIYCVKSLCEEYSKQFTKNYHQQFMRISIDRLNSEKVLRNQLEILSALNSFVAESSDTIVNIYIRDLLTILLPEFAKLDLNLPINLRKEIINLITEIVNVIGDTIQPYSEEILRTMNDAFMFYYANKVNISLYKEFIECISLMGSYCKETFIKIVPSFVKTLLEIQNNISLTTDPTRGFLESAYANLIPILKDHFKELLPEIVNSVFKLVQNLPEMSISSVPTQEFKIDDLLSNLNQDNEIKIKNVKDINTSSTEEMESSIKLLKTTIIYLNELFLPYLEMAQKEIIPLINYKFNSNIRIAASKILPHLIEIVQKNSSKDIAGNLAKFYIGELLSSIQNENELDNTAFYSKIKRVGKIVSKLDYFLSKDELNKLFENLARLIDETEKRRISLLDEKKKLTDLQTKKSTNIQEEDDDDNEDIDLLEDIEDDIEEIENIQSAISDTIGFSFKTHKDVTHDIVNYIITNWLPKYFRTGASYFEISMGIFIIDDMMQYLGQAFLGNYWKELVKTLIIYTTNQDHIVRRAANYGIGEVAEFTTSDFNLYAADMCNGLYQSLLIHMDKNDEASWGAAKDNATRSLGKIMKFHSNEIDLRTCFNVWLTNLPIVYDELESVEQHELLCDFVLNKAEFSYGENFVNFNQIVKVFSRVYASKLFTDVKVDEKILTITKTWGENKVMMDMVQSIMNSCDKKDLKKIKKMLKLN